MAARQEAGSAMTHAQGEGDDAEDEDDEEDDDEEDTTSTAARNPATTTAIVANDTPSIWPAISRSCGASDGRNISSPAANEMKERARSLIAVCAKERDRERECVCVCVCVCV